MKIQTTKELIEELKRLKKIKLSKFSNKINELLFANSKKKRNISIYRELGLENIKIKERNNPINFNQTFNTLTSLISGGKEIQEQLGLILQKNEEFLDYMKRNKIKDKNKEKKLISEDREIKRVLKMHWRN